MADGGCCISGCDSRVPYERVDANPCDVSITVTAAMEPPVYMYYKLTNYYQNHRRYVRSRDDNQLKGDTRTLSQIGAQCTYHYETASGEMISPCGLVAWSAFNDSFAISDAAGNAIALNETGIAWPSDLGNKFSNAENGTTGLNFPLFAQWRQATCAQLPTAAQRDACAASPATPDAGWCYPGSGYCVEDEHFVVWMRAAGLPNFRKLYGTVETRLEPGTYTLRITNGQAVTLGGDTTYTNPATGVAQRFLYPVSSFGGTKSIVLSTTSWMGGRNFFLGYAYVVVGVVCIVLALCFCLKYGMSPRDLGDAAYITWQKDTTPG